MESAEVVQKINKCWGWTGYVNARGYGSFNYSRFDTPKRIHKLVYESFSGLKVPIGMCIDHLCRNRKCINPFHFEIVTPEINCSRGIGIPAINARKNYCKRNHPLIGSNLKLRVREKDGNKRIERSCRECNKMHLKKWRINIHKRGLA